MTTQHDIKIYAASFIRDGQEYKKYFNTKHECDRFASSVEGYRVTKLVCTIPDLPDYLNSILGQPKPPITAYVSATT